MGPGRDQTCDPWICSQTSISSQLHSHRLRYMAGIMCLDPHQNYIVTDYAIWPVTMCLDPHQNYIVTDYAIWPVTMCLDPHQNYIVTDYAIWPVTMCPDPHQN